MPATLELHDSERYLIFRLNGNLDINELMILLGESTVIRDRFPHKLHAIIDSSQMVGIPKNWTAVRNNRAFDHPKSGLYLFTGLTPGVRILVNLVMIKYKDRAKFFNSVAEAQKYLERVD